MGHGFSLLTLFGEAGLSVGRADHVEGAAGADLGQVVAEGRDAEIVAVGLPLGHARGVARRVQAAHPDGWGWHRQFRAAGWGAAAGWG
jgi:hypothetical protein